MDAGFEQVENATMALCAGLGYVGAIDAGLRIVGRQLAMGGVAVGAVGRDRETALEQALAMDAVAIAFHDVLFRSPVAKRCFLAGAVATRAEIGHVSRKRSRVGIVAAEDFVRRVAVVACRRIGAALREQLAVSAALVLRDLVRVANGTVDFFRDGAARARIGGRTPRMALHARLL